MTFPFPFFVKSALTWTTIYSGSMNTDNGGAVGFSLRALIPISGLSGAKSLIRITIGGHSTNTSTVYNWSVGVPATAPNTVATPVELKISGASGFSLGAGGSSLSDEAAFSLSGSETNLIVIFDSNNGYHPYRNSIGTEYYKSASASYNQSSVSGYSSIAFIPFVTKIEVA